MCGAAQDRLQMLEQQLQETRATSGGKTALIEELRKVGSKSRALEEALSEGEYLREMLVATKVDLETTREALSAYKALSGSPMPLLDRRGESLKAEEPPSIEGTFSVAYDLRPQNFGSPPPSDMRVPLTNWWTEAYLPGIEDTHGVDNITLVRGLKDATGELTAVREGPYIGI